MSYPHYYYAHPASAIHPDDEFLQPRRHCFAPGPRPFRPDPYARLASPSPAPSPYRPSHPGFYRDAPPPHVSPYARYYATEDIDGEDDDDALLLAEEEARRHLELIQRRRETARLAAERERAERAHRAEYEAFVAAREAAARQAKEAAIKREIALQQALARQREAGARAHAQAAEQERLRKEVEKQVKFQILAQQKEQLARQKREAEARRQREEYLRAQHAAEQAVREQTRHLQQLRQQQAAEAAAAARSTCARPRIQGRPSHPLLALFAPEQHATETKKEVKPAPTPKPVQTPRAAPSPAPTPKKDDKKESAQPSFPRGLNDLLSHFLGLQVEHADKDEKAATAQKDGDNTKVIDGLNELFGQFGLVFEPEDDKSAAPKAESSQKPANTKPATPEPAAAKRPESPRQRACECSHADDKTSEPAVFGLPDFIKYALEAAMNDGCPAKCSPAAKKVDKGKGVAEGEKKPRAKPAAAAPKPAPAPATSQPAPAPEVKPTPADSISKLKSIANEFALARESFKFPDRLVFGPTATASDPQHPPALLFNKINSPYHAQTNKLLQLLLAADNVTSDGDPAVRQERKALVKELEKEIELLEQKRDQVWEEIRGQRERGEEEVEVESVSSGASVVDPVEHAEHAEHVEHHTEPVESDTVIVETPIEDNKAEVNETTETAPQTAAEAATEPEVTGFDVPAPATDKATEPETVQHEPEATKDDAPAETQSEEKIEEKASEPTTPLPELERKQSRQATVEDETKEDEYEVL